MFQIVASDLDGTLLSPEYRLTPYAHEVLQQLVARDIHFVFATGRHYTASGARYPFCLRHRTSLY